MAEVVVLRVQAWMPGPPRGLTNVLIFVVLQDREERRSREQSAGALLSWEELHKNAYECIRNPLQHL